MVSLVQYNKASNITIQMSILEEPSTGKYQNINLIICLPSLKLTIITNVFYPGGYNRVVHAHFLSTAGQCKCHIKCGTREIYQFRT